MKKELEEGAGDRFGQFVRYALYFLARGAKQVYMVDSERRFLLGWQDERVAKEICNYLEKT